MSFEAVTLAELEAMSATEHNSLPYGVVGFSQDTTVNVYNATEARMAGLDASQVVGAHFFEAVAQCMNNFMVAQRFQDEPDLDDIVPYVLTLRMRPTRVRLRLLATAGGLRRYVLVER